MDIKKENKNVQSNESGIQEDWKKNFKRCKKSSNSNSNPKNQYAIYVEQQENSEIDNALFTLRSLEKNSVGNQSY